MKKQPIAPHYFTGEAGRCLVRLHVNNSDAPAVTEADLWDNAKRRLGLTGNLYLSGDGKGHSYVTATIPGSGSHKPLARVLLGQPGGYRVRYIDRNPLNLLPENFRLDAPWADEGTATEALARLMESARRDSGGAGEVAV